MSRPPAVPPEEKVRLVLSVLTRPSSRERQFQDELEEVRGATWRIATRTRRPAQNMPAPRKGQGPTIE